MLEIIGTYWPQFSFLLTILIGGTSYLLKIYFDWDLRRREIIFNQIKETKIMELKNFYISFFRLEACLKDLYQALAEDNEESEQEARNEFSDLWIKFKLSFTYLKVFLDLNEIEPFEKLKAILENIHLKLDFYKIDQASKESDRELIKELRKIGREIFPKKIPEIFDVIENNLKKDFKITNMHTKCFCVKQKN
ncbi:MAG: hypothetical protein GX128_09060 [Bacteroidales bacterium]|jgi:hypothetical protein|nr:hypothetical protein [Bacteroidales bacterium]